MNKKSKNKKRFKAILPGGEMRIIKLGFLTYSKNKEILFEAGSLFEAYAMFPKALEIKEITSFEMLKNSLLYRQHNMKLNI